MPDFLAIFKSLMIEISAILIILIFFFRGYGAPWSTIAFATVAIIILKMLLSRLKIQTFDGTCTLKRNDGLYQYPNPTPISGDYM